MGSTNWSDDVYTARKAREKATGRDAFSYDTAAKALADKTGDSLEVHSSLNVKGVNLRESRDSDIHPESLAISVHLDVTGSMRRVPRLLREKLNTLMGLLLKKGYVDHPQIMFGAIGDTHFDEAPIQLGQWESGIEQDDNITHLILEGGGGDGLAESHGLTMYFMANHTAMDCFEKRGKKGYMFIVTDEPTYPVVTRAELEKWLGQTVQADIPIEKIVEQLKEKFEVFILIPSQTANHKNREMLESWLDMFGQNVVKINDPANTIETIASLIGVAEGRLDPADIGNHLKEMGSHYKTIEDVTMAVTKYSQNSGVIKRAKGIVKGDLPKSDTDDTVSRV